MSRADRLLDSRKVGRLGFGQAEPFLAALDPKAAAQDLVDDSFVRKAVTAVGGLTAFGLVSNDFTRREIVAA